MKKFLEQLLKMAQNITALALWILPPSNSQIMKIDGEEPNGWNGVFKLVFLSAVATGGTMGSVFVISAVTVIEPFQVRGSIYLVSLAMGNMLVTILVLPASCVAILANIPQDPSICTFQWLTTVVCFLVSVQSFMFMALDNCLGLNSLVTYDLCCTKWRILFGVSVVWCCSVSFAVIQYVMGYGPSFCDSNFNVWPPYHITAGILLVICPLLLTIIYFTRAIFKLRDFKLQLEVLEDPTAYVLTDECLLKSNIVVFIVMLMMWMPYAVVIVISALRPVTINLMDTSWWVAITNSCLYSYVYAATNRDFREAFNKLFYYCCCKSHVTFTRRSRDPRRAGNGIGLRVHIIPGLNIYAQRKETAKELRVHPPCKGTCDL
ncbi:histamine H2 receptor-like isoform X1 [Centruroides vittatus]|uniref:histamine H2 receptor-like isoform X2 n=1 Tax=Centruroides sculpturatus TaxID=218467 RepID=UPI000C6D00AB|nr:histamine H2 receptor-like isoform X2 [Centruroides sculpturatus]